MITASQFFARARGERVVDGPHACWYCGALCDETHTAKTWVKPNNTIRQYAACPSSDYVCGGCAASMSERATVQVADEPEPRQGKRVRNFSWVVARERATAYTKAHIEKLQELCLHPPAQPYLIVLTSSGQKQLIWQSQVCRSSEWAVVQLDDDTITYRPRDLRERSLLTEAVCAATGKPALVERLGFNVYRGLSALDPVNGVALADEWARVWPEPLSQLASWLTPKKEVSLARYHQRRA